MILGVLYCVASVVFVVFFARRSLGHGFGALFAVGYTYGIVRANLYDGVSHFAFDLAIASLYGTAFMRRPDPATRMQSRLASAWLKALLVVPVVMFFVPLQHPFVQTVGLRAAILFLPVVLLGARMRSADVHDVARWLVALNLGAVAVGTVEYFLGVERFFPHNDLTRIIYASSDVGAARALRIPATFSSAHAFGGTMVATLPFMAVAAADATRRRLLFTLFSVAATLTGIFMCGARSPVAHLFLFGGLSIATARLSIRARLGLALPMIVVLGFVAVNERFQRFTTLADAEMVAVRLGGSANLGIIDAVLDYPLGVGLARAGTSIPFFLQHLAAPPIGFENEYARVALEQGIAGLAVFVLFIVDVVRRSTRRNPIVSPATAPLFRYFVAVFWASAFIGTGSLTSIPGSIFLLLMMGVLLAQRERPRVPYAPPGRTA